MPGGKMGTDNKKGREGNGEISYLVMGDLINRLTETAVRSAIRGLQLPPGSRGLDAGCGIGNHTLWLAEAVSPGGHVTGVDISEECIARAQETARKSKAGEQVSFQIEDISKLPFENDSFDWLWSADTLYLWLMGTGGLAEVSLPLMSELKRVVKPGGIIAILFWTSQKLLPGYPLLEARLNATRAANFVGATGIRPELHSSRALGWLQNADLEETGVRTFVLDIQVPLNDETREALSMTFQMFWRKAKSEVTPEDWGEYQRLCDPESPDFILDLPDYYAFLTYSLFFGRVEK